MRRIVAATAVLVASALLAGALATGAVAQETQSIDNCTVVDEPGEYELAGDVTTNESQTCIEVRAGDVVIDGNGHAVDGPGAEDGTNSSAAGVLVDGADANVTVRNVTVTGFDVGVSATGAATVEASELTVKFNGDGLVASGTDVVIDNSSVRANDGNGVEIQSDATLTSADSYLNDNGGHGIVAAGDVSLWDDETARNDGVGLLLEDGATADLTWTTVALNGDDGIRTGDATIDMEDVIIKHNDGYELDARNGRSTADDLDLNLTVISAFEDEAIAAETVDAEELPGRSDNATAAGDGLEVLGTVDGQVEMVFDVETADDTVEVRRHDGDGWTTVAQNVSVNNGTAEYTADASGTYAPVESASDEQEDADGTDEGDEGEQSDESDDEQEDADESDDASSDSGSSSTSSGYSSSTSSGSSGSSSSDRGGPLASTPTPTPTEESAENETDDESEEPTETETDDETQSAEQDDDDDVAAAPEADDEDDENEDGASFADGPGFTGLAALLALLASAALAQRRW